MSSDFKELQSKITLLKDVVILLSASSVIFYLIGYLNEASYYSTLGVKLSFLDFTYNHFALTGFLQTLGYILFLVYNMSEPYPIIYQLRLIKSKVNKIESKKPKEGRVLSKKITGFENRLVNAIKKTFFYKTALFFAISSIILLIISIFIKEYSLTAFSFSLAITSIELLLFIYLSILTIKAKKLIDTLPIFSIVIIITLIAAPILSGYIEATLRLKSNDFDQYELKTTDNKDYKITYLIYYGKNTYFLKINNKLNIIHESKISLLQKK